MMSLIASSLLPGLSPVDLSPPDSESRKQPESPSSFPQAPSTDFLLLAAHPAPKRHQTESVSCALLASLIRSRLLRSQVLPEH